MLNIRLALLMLLSFLIGLGCSGSDTNPMLPPDPSGISATAEKPGSSRVLWGIWDIGFNASTGEVIVTPNRKVLSHFNITDWLIPPACDDCLKISINSYDPGSGILDADLTLRNPTQMQGSDVRGILYTNDEGYVLTNGDGWTDLFDIPVGGDINPFKAYAKAVTNRKFFPNTSHTQNYLVYIPPPPQWEPVVLAVDASWPSNCREPYSIENFTHTPIYDVPGSFGKIQVDILDWQWDISTATLEAPGISAEESLPFTHLEGNTWELMLANDLDADAGEYSVKVTAWSSNSGDLAMHQFFQIDISAYVSNFNPVNVTPPEITLTLWELFIEGDYVYVTGQGNLNYGVQNGLHIIDISDPLNTSCVGSIETELPVWDVDVDNNFTYLVGQEAGFSQLYIVNTASVESPTLINTVDLPWVARDVDVVDGYAYIAHWSGLYVVDVDPPGEAAIIHEGSFYTGLDGIVVSGNYAYGTNQDTGLEIFNIEDPSDPYMVKSVPIPYGYHWSLDVSGDYAYVISYKGLAVIDVSDPASAEIVQFVEFPSTINLYDIEVSGNFAYLSHWGGGMFIVDITEPESAYTLAEIYNYNLPCKGISVSGDYVFLANLEWGLEVIDVSQPEWPESVHTHFALNGTDDVEVSDEYAYIERGIGYAGGGPWYFYDINPLKSTYLAGQGPDNTSWPMDSVTQDGYLYQDHRNGNNFEFKILDVDPVESAYVIQTLDLSSRITALAMSDGYVYAACDDYSNGQQGIYIFDVNPPASAFIAQEIETIDTPYLLEVLDDYLYCITTLSYDEELMIIDISTPGAAEIIQTLPLQHGPLDIAVANGYAYAASGSQGLVVIDVDPPDLAHVVLYVGDSTYSYRQIEISGGYAYVVELDIPSADYGYMHIFDLSQPEAPFIVETFEILEEVEDVAIYENHIYVSGGEKGMRIYELW